jgi:hypothetical protein
MASNKQNGNGIDRIVEDETELRLFDLEQKLKMLTDLNKTMIDAFNKERQASDHLIKVLEVRNAELEKENRELHLWKNEKIKQQFIDSTKKLKPIGFSPDEPAADKNKSDTIEQ